MKEYEHVYLLKNKDTNKFLLYYCASSQKHKAIFSTQKKAEEAVNYIQKETPNIEIIEL